ncbi:MAG: HU family DNA-binding protein [Proteobacteria bacterium]|nr:HU family DNA-binding protein [Pseudomonadota bacterium]
MSMKKKTMLKSKMAVKSASKRAQKETVAKKARASAKVLKAAIKAAPALPNKAISQKQTKSQIYAEIAEIAKVSKHDAKNILAAIRNLVERHVKTKGSGEIVIPDLGIKVRRVQKKATKARMGRNPFTGEEIQIPAKPARKSVKVSAMKTLKALIEE